MLTQIKCNHSAASRLTLYVAWTRLWLDRALLKRVAAISGCHSGLGNHEERCYRRCYDFSLCNFAAGRNNRSVMGKSSKIWKMTAFALLVVLGAAWLGFDFAERYYFRQTAEQSGSTLRLAVAGLRGALNRYEPLPSLIADKADIKLLLTNPQDSGLANEVNLQLRDIANQVAASDVYVMDTDGLTLAASNFDTATSFVSRNFSYRPYFQIAAKGGLGRYFARGTTSLKRGYYFAAPVHFAGRITGVVTVKINVDNFEATWRGNRNEIVVSDDKGIIFMSSRPEWHFKSLGSLSTDDRAAIETSRQYPVGKLGELEVVSEVLEAADAHLMSVAGEGNSEQYIVNRMTMPEAGWTVDVLTPTSAATAQAYAAVLTVVLVVLLIVLATAYLLQRRAVLFERIKAQRDAQEGLEKSVLERTADLNTANAQLRLEVEERTAAESQLRKAQADLVQAGKLAALGQMSAALSHEINQPLAAAKSYADNANAYLDRDRPKEARQNIGRISELIDRMAAISKHLRNFARKPQEKTGPIPLAIVINDAMEIMSGRLKSRSADVAMNLPKTELWVRGGQVRLQQVLVNLINNALDAVPEDTKTPEIKLSVVTENKHVCITVRDNGPGLDKDVVDHIFDPFFTTKGTSKGLGLGLSISYNIIKDFGGDLSASNHDDGGAEFTIRLEAAQQISEIAAE